MAKNREEKNDKKKVLVRIICIALAIAMVGTTIVAVIIGLIKGF